MKIFDLSRLKAMAEKNKYVLPVLALGLLLIFLPSGEGEQERSGQGSKLESSGIPMDTEGERMGEFLSAIEGVGVCRVLLSSEGAVVACSGAEDAAVRLCVINAVSSYTGLGSDKISVIKLK